MSQPARKVLFPEHDKDSAPIAGHNVPPVQDQLDRLERKCARLETALGMVIAAVMPAMQVIGYLEEATKVITQGQREDD